MKHLTVVGSCRIHAPMQTVAKQGLLSLDNCGTRGYVHSLSEIIQLLRFLRGEEALSSSILPFIPFECLEDLHNSGPVFHGNTEKFVVEVCSIKEFRINGQYIQMNLLFEKIRSYKMEEDYFNLCERINSSPGIFCPFSVLQKTAPEGIKKFFASLEGISLTQEQVCTKLKELQRLLKRPLAIVTHIELDEHEEDLTVSLYQRSAGVAFLREAGKQLKIPVIEPGVFVKRIGKDILMQQGSTTHYKPEANIIMGKWFLRQLE